MRQPAVLFFYFWKLVTLEARGQDAPFRRDNRRFVSRAPGKTLKKPDASSLCRGGGGKWTSRRAAKRLEQRAEDSERGLCFFI